MKLEKLNEKKIALSNEMMHNIIGGVEFGDTQLKYTGEPWGQPSSDRITQTWTNPGDGGAGFWADGNGCYINDLPTNPTN